MFLLEQLDHWAETTPQAPAIVFCGDTISFDALRKRVNRIAADLAGKQSVGLGDRVAYLGVNHPDVVALVFACAKLGAIFAPFNSRLARDEYAYLIGNSEPRVCIFDEGFRNIAESLADMPCRFLPLEQLGQNGDVSALQDVQNTGDDPLLLVYTSGTTGRPKGVLLTGDAVAANIENGQRVYAFEPGQNVLITLPLFHVGGLCILLLPALTHGATIHLHARFDPVATLDAIEQQKITTTILVPAQMSAMLATPRWGKVDLTSMHYLVVGSSRIPTEQIKAWHWRGVPVSQVYGATETGPTAVALPLADAFEREGSAGLPAPLCRIDVRQSDGTQSATGENGEIWVSGPNVMAGYWRDAELTQTVLQDGWYNTGDIGHVDDDGFYWIVDRSKDVIISGGENIYPAEVEAALIDHPAIAAVAVVGKPDPHWVETPVAAVELLDGASLTCDDIQDFLKDRLARFKQPKDLIVFENLPRNAMGKIEKSVLRESVSASDLPARAVETTGE